VTVVDPLMSACFRRLFCGIVQHEGEVIEIRWSWIPIRLLDATSESSASRGKSAIALQHQVIGLLPLQGFIMNYKPI